MGAQCNVIWLTILGVVLNKCVLYKTISWKYCYEEYFPFPAKGELGMQSKGNQIIY